MDTFDFLLNPLFFGHSTENSKTDFSKFRESLPFLYINLKWRAKIQISRLLILDSLVGCFYTLKITKKRGSSINLDIHHSKVTSSDRLDLGLHLLQYYCTMYFSSWFSNLLSKCKLNIWSKLCKYICIYCLYIIYLK